MLLDGRLLPLALPLALAVPGPAAARVSVRLPYTERYAVWPDRFEYADLRLVGLRPWHGWGGGRAVAYGRGVSNSCSPSCASGAVRHFKVRVVLDQLRRHGAHRTYDCLTYTAYGRGAPRGEHGSFRPDTSRACGSSLRACRGSEWGGYYRGLREARTSCVAARGLMRAWVHRYAAGSTRHRTHRIGPWRCTLRLSHNRAGDPYRAISCTASWGRRVRFVGSP